METQAANWEAVHKLLAEARDYLTPEIVGQNSVPAPVGPLTGTVEEFTEFLDHNELELAWEALAAVAERGRAAVDCWHKLAQAARLMGLPAKEEAALRHAAPGERLDPRETV